MCDPVTLASISAAMPALSTASTVAGLAGSAMSAIGSMNAQKEQESQINSWVQKQTQTREAQQARQEELRQNAETARQQGVQAIGAENQKKVQSEEEARLAEYLQGKGEASEASPEAALTPVSDADILAQNVTGDQEVTSDLAKKLNEATKGAQQRLQALAGVSSYGGSSGGLGTVNPLAQAEAGQGIDLANDKRRGEMAVYDLQQGINPVQVQYQPSPLADVFSTLGQIGAAGMGNATGKKLFSKTAAVGADPWAGILGANRIY